MTGGNPTGRGKTIEPRQAPRVLLIHRSDQRAAYGTYLSQAGFRIVDARHAQEAFDQTVPRAPDCVVLDGHVNDEAVARLRADSAATHRPIIALASAPESSKAEKKDDLGAEHARLLDEMEALRREDAELERHPGDLAAHAAHRVKLRGHIEELQAHIDKWRHRRR
jgi:CheY-like chemotaxis protein